MDRKTHQFNQRLKKRPFQPEGPNAPVGKQQGSNLLIKEGQSQNVK
jgi:hypothetical protein